MSVAVLLFLFVGGGFGFFEIFSSFVTFVNIFLCLGDLAVPTKFRCQVNNAWGSPKKKRRRSKFHEWQNGSIDSILK